MKEVHIGEDGVVRVKELYDANGNVTTRYDAAAGVVYTTTHPGMVDVADTDINPWDAELDFSALTPDGEDAFVNISFDGDPSDFEHRVELQSEAIRVVAGDAVSGLVEIEVTPVTPVVS